MAEGEDQEAHWRGAGSPLLRGPLGARLVGLLNSFFLVGVVVMLAGSVSYVIRAGPRALLAYVFVPFGGIGLHTYSVILYSCVFLLWFRGKWKTSSTLAFMLLWSVNELTFDVLWGLKYPALFVPGVFPSLANVGYVVTLVLALPICAYLVRPGLKIGLATAAFPVFLAVWVSLGMPLIFEPPAGSPPIWNNWPWELGYQLSLLATFLYTVRARLESPP